MSQAALLNSTDWYGSAPSSCVAAAVLLWLSSLHGLCIQDSTDQLSFQNVTVQELRCKVAAALSLSLIMMHCCLHHGVFVCYRALQSFQKANSIQPHDTTYMQVRNRCCQCLLL